MNINLESEINNLTEEELLKLHKMVDEHLEYLKNSLISLELEDGGEENE